MHMPQPQWTPATDKSAPTAQLMEDHPGMNPYMYVSQSLGLNPLHQHPMQKAVDQPPVVSTPTATQVGTLFALQYFKIMKSSPQDLPRFYGANSQIFRAVRTLKDPPVEYHQAAGFEQISKLLYRIHMCAPPFNKVVINALHSQETVDEAIFVHMHCTLQYANNRSQDIVMSALLMPQNRAASPGYFILNDSVIDLTSLCPEEFPSPPVEAPAVASETVGPPAEPQEVQKSAVAEAPPSAPVKDKPEPVKPHDFQEPSVMTSAEKQQVADKPQGMHVDKDSVQENSKASALEAEASTSEVIVSDVDEDESDEPKPQASTVPEVPPKPTSQAPTTTAPPVRPVSQPKPPIQYAKDSYAGALFTQGALPPPCQIGYAVRGPEKIKPPPPQEVVTKQQQQTAPKQHTQMRDEPRSPPQGLRTRTLYIAQMPQQISEDTIKAEILDHLRNHAIEGCVLRIERVLDQLYGFIELDTDSCAQFLVGEPFPLDGKLIKAAYAGRSYGNRSNTKRDPASFKPRRNQYPPRQDHGAGPPRGEPQPPKSEDGWREAGPKRRQKASPQQQAYVSGQSRRLKPTSAQPQVVN